MAPRTPIAVFPAQCIRLRCSGGSRTDRNDLPSASEITRATVAAFTAKYPSIETAAAPHAAGSVEDEGCSAWNRSSAHVIATRNCEMLNTTL